MRLLDATATAELLPFVPLSEEIETTLDRKALGGVTAPERLNLPLPGGGVLLVMSAADEDLAVTKLVTVSPGNSSRGLPLILGEVVVMRADTGERLGVLDGPEVTARRTAAASLLAADLLAPNPRGTLLIVGAGVQALSHALAFASGLGVTKIFLCARDRAKADTLARRLEVSGIDATSVAHPEDALEQATLIVTATNSPSPVLPTVVREDAFIAAVGSFNPGRAEIPAALVRRCHLFVDDLEAARSEAGDLVLAGVNFGEVTPLERVCLARRSGRVDGAKRGPVLYKAVGHAALDLAAARLAFDARLKR